MILGITGTIGAGKGTVVNYLTSTRKFTHFSARKFITKEIELRGLSATRDSMKRVADDLRARHTPSYIIECLFKEARERGGNAVIESVRTTSEARFLKSQGAKILAVDAARVERYKRVISRGLSTDHVSFEEFCRQEDAELSNDDPNQQNILGVMALSDMCIINDDVRQTLFENVEAFLKCI